MSDELTFSMNRTVLAGCRWATVASTAKDQLGG
jgi:hypothetical protein